MKVLICGSRDFFDRALMKRRLRDLLQPEDTVIHGASKGADTIAAQIAEGIGCTVIPFPAKWKQPCNHARCKTVNYCKEAGKMRNTVMLGEGPDLVIAFFNGKRSPGTYDTVLKARNAGIPVMEFGLGEEEHN